MTTDFEDEEELDYEDVLIPEDKEDASIGGGLGADDADDHLGGQESSVDSAILLGGTSEMLNDKEMVMSNPHLRKLLDRMLDECLKQVEKHG